MGSELSIVIKTSDLANVLKFFSLMKRNSQFIHTRAVLFDRLSDEEYLLRSSDGVVYLSAKVPVVGRFIDKFSLDFDTLHILSRFMSDSFSIFLKDGSFYTSLLHGEVVIPSYEHSTVYWDNLKVSSNFRNISTFSWVPVVSEFLKSGGAFIPGFEYAYCVGDSVLACNGVSVLRVNGPVLVKGNIRKCDLGYFEFFNPDLREVRFSYDERNLFIDDGRMSFVIPYSINPFSPYYSQCLNIDSSEVFRVDFDLVYKYLYILSSSYRSSDTGVLVSRGGVLRLESMNLDGKVSYFNLSSSEGVVDRRVKFKLSDVMKVVHSFLVSGSTYNLFLSNNMFVVYNDSVRGVVFGSEDGSGGFSSNFSNNFSNSFSYKGVCL